MPFFPEGEISAGDILSVSAMVMDRSFTVSIRFGVSDMENPYPGPVFPCRCGPFLAENPRFILRMECGSGGIRFPVGE